MTFLSAVHKARVELDSGSPSSAALRVCRDEIEGWHFKAWAELSAETALDEGHEVRRLLAVSADGAVARHAV